MMRAVLSTLVAAAAAAPPALAQTLLDNRLRVQTWASGLSAPTTFTWIGPGEMLVIEKDTGKVKWIKDGAVLGTALDLKVQFDSERGGLGICADPDFANNKWVYVYYSTTTANGDSSTSSRWSDNRVERYEWNGSTLVNKFGPLVAFPTDATQANGPNHDGGPIRFGPDGMLYGQTGDLNRGDFGGGRERVEQNTATSGSASVGGIFRLVNDGTIPADNPFLSESDSALHLWFSYGLRNGFGICFDELTGAVWNTENGPDLFDEVCMVPPGGNSGWLKIMGPDQRNAKYSKNGNTSYDASELTYLANAVYYDPALSFKTPVGITAIEFLHSGRFPPDLRDHCVFADSNLGQIYFCEMRAARDNLKMPSGLGDRVIDNTTERDLVKWGTGFAGVTDLHVGADGYLYAASIGSGRIYRIRPVTDSVEPSQMLLMPGVAPANDPERMGASDDKWYLLEEKVRRKRMFPYVILSRFVLNDAAPNSVVLELESHYGGFGHQQDVYVRNFVTGKWDQLDSRMVGSTDVPLAFPLSNVANYVDPAQLTVEVRIDVSPPGFSFRPRRRPPVNLWIDLFQLSVTYP